MRMHLLSIGIYILTQVVLVNWGGEVHLKTFIW